MINLWHSSLIKIFEMTSLATFHSILHRSQRFPDKDPRKRSGTAGGKNIIVAQVIGDPWYQAQCHLNPSRHTLRETVRAAPPEFLKGETMFKKLLCLMAALVLVAACDTTGSNEGEGGANGASGANGAHGAARPGTQEDLVVNVGDRVFFSFNESDLSTEAQATLDRQATWLKKYATSKVTIEGHCDERGTREYNLALGERRATAAKNYLVAAGIDAGRITTISYGKERPAVVGSNEAAWAQNRRAVTVIAQ